MSTKNSSGRRPRFDTQPAGLQGKHGNEPLLHLPKIDSKLLTLLV
jgi:hypothetical protein